MARWIYGFCLAPAIYNLNAMQAYKIWVGKYRIGITIEQERNTLICERIAHQKDIYRIFP